MNGVVSAHTFAWHAAHRPGPNPGMRRTGGADFRPNP